MSASTHMALSGEGRRWLLDRARRSIRAALTQEPPAPDEARPAEVETPGACFVSLHRRSGELRGCIGTFDDAEPLWQNVTQMAIAAATRDYRFQPLTAGELDECVIEISALTPRAPIKPEDVIIGEHGLCVASRGRRGVLLPQVASSLGWDRKTFLEHTCLKAGLSRDAWKDPETSLEAFSAEVFEEA